MKQINVSFCLSGLRDWSNNFFCKFIFTKKREGKTSRQRKN